MELTLRFDDGVELPFKTASLLALLWLIIFLVFWLFKAGRIAYHRVRIKFLRIRFKRKYLRNRVVRQGQVSGSYRYQPLQGPESKHIRLLELLSDGSVRMRMSSLAGPDIPQYEALSYCWGDAAELYRVDILVHNEADGEKVEHLWVSHGLRLALERLILKDSVRVLWIDAICINQTDLSEKSWQVSMMTDIYENASRVLVYLDVPGGFESRIGDIIPRLVQVKQAVDISPHSEITWDDLESHKELQKMTKPPYLREIDIASLYLLENPWFWRVWVIQESSLARDASVICEGWELPWKSLSEAYNWVGRSHHWKYREGSTRLSLLEISRSNATREDLYTLLLRHRGTLASDPRDHIFALLGLAQDGDQITVDYDMSPSEVFIMTAKHILLTQKNLGYLSAAGTSQRKESRLPSWVPDMRTKPRQRALLDDYKRSVSEIGVACSGDDLSFTCCRVGRVTMIGESAPDLPQDPSNKSFIDMKVYSALFNWRRISKACSVNLYTMGCITQRDFVWPCMSDSRCHSKYKNIDPSGFDFQLWFHFLASLLPIPQSFRLVWDSVYVMSVIQLIVLILCYRVTGKSFMKIVFNDVCFGRRLIKIDDSYFGLAPSDTNVGDEIFLIQGISMFIVIRKDGAKYKFIGEGYLGISMLETAGLYKNWQSITLC